MPFFLLLPIFSSLFECYILRYATFNSTVSFVVLFDYINLILCFFHFHYCLSWLFDLKFIYIWTKSAQLAQFVFIVSKKKENIKRTSNQQKKI